MIVITPKTKVGELLDAYPQLEEKLMELSPRFQHLKNKMLRRTIAKIATLQQAAQMADIRVEVLVNALRREIGQPELNISENYTNAIKPAWIENAEIAITIDITPMLNTGQHPLPYVTEQINQLKPGQILKLIAPFYPAPLIDIMKEKGIEIYTQPQEQDKLNVFFYKKKQE